jgi:hypothetical protein
MSKVKFFDLTEQERIDKTDELFFRLEALIAQLELLLGKGTEQ